MEIMPLKAALAVAKSAATARATGNQEFKFEAASDNGEFTFAISAGSLILSTVKDISRYIIVVNTIVNKMPSESSCPDFLPRNPMLPYAQSRYKQKIR